MRPIRRDKVFNTILAVSDVERSGTGLPTSVPQSTRPIGACYYLANQRLRQFVAWPPGLGELYRLIGDYSLAVSGLPVDRVSKTTKPLFQDETDIPAAIDEFETLFSLADDLFGIRGNSHSLMLSGALRSET